MPVSVVLCIPVRTRESSKVTHVPLFYPRPSTGSPLPPAPTLQLDPPAQEHTPSPSLTRARLIESLANKIQDPD